MTTPDERSRSLRWACELLAEIDLDLEVSEELRLRARPIAKEFPTPQALQALFTSEPTCFPDSFAKAIESARDLFVEVQGSATGSSATRKSVLYTLRHYPSARNVKSVTAGWGPWGIEDWIARESSQD